jgi:hypothetical protein
MSCLLNVRGGLAPLDNFNAWVYPLLKRVTGFQKLTEGISIRMPSDAYSASET